MHTHIHIYIHTYIQSLLSHICNSYHENTGVLEQFVGAASWETVAGALDAISNFGEDVVIVLDGVGFDDQAEVYMCGLCVCMYVCMYVCGHCVNVVIVLDGVGLED